ncbi:hypothetical protein M422DRAFT_27788 [Sphaerobolus stellatus SS14]|nr:hypothetical protein M422DRAFT_27788 [Sphaerobolus stellatus SS14]
MRSFLLFVRTALLLPSYLTVISATARLIRSFHGGQPATHDVSEPTFIRVGDLDWQYKSLQASLPSSPLLDETIPSLGRICSGIHIRVNLFSNSFVVTGIDPRGESSTEQTAT